VREFGKLTELRGNKNYMFLWLYVHNCANICTQTH